MPSVAARQLASTTGSRVGGDSSQGSGRALHGRQAAGIHTLPRHSGGTARASQWQGKGPARGCMPTTTTPPLPCGSAWGRGAAEAKETQGWRAEL